MNKNFEKVIEVKENVLIKAIEDAGNLYEYFERYGNQGEEDYYCGVECALRWVLSGALGTCFSDDELGYIMDEEEDENTQEG